MEKQFSLEKLQTDNRELREALEKLATSAHYAAKDKGSFSHRGAFHNCPDENCVYVRVLIGKTDEYRS